MKFKEIASRLTGISSPIFGVSWNPPESERTIAKRIIVELEDKRVLYVPSEVEVPSHCSQSIINIRRLITEELSTLSDNSELVPHLRAMRTACRKFLNIVQADKKIITFGADYGHYASWRFIGAVGELRGVFGIHIAQIAVKYGLDVEDDLSSILPEKE